MLKSITHTDYPQLLILLNGGSTVSIYLNFLKFRVPIAILITFYRKSVSYFWGIVNLPLVLFKILSIVKYVAVGIDSTKKFFCRIQPES